MSDRPSYTLGHDDPVLRDLPFHVRAQVTQTLMTQLMAEIVDQAGGEIILPPGYRERAGTVTRTIETTFLDDGSYRIRTLDLPEAIVFIGKGTRWERMEGPRRREQRAVIYEVVEEDRSREHYTGLRKVGEGGKLTGPVVSVSTSALRKGAGGWRPWNPPDTILEEAPGSDV